MERKWLSRNIQRGWKLLGACLLNLLERDSFRSVQFEALYEGDKLS